MIVLSQNTQLGLAEYELLRNSHAISQHRAVFGQTFNVEAAVLAEQGQRKKYVPDEGWEPVSRIVTTCRLLRKSKYIPGAVLKVLRNAKKTSKVKRSKASGGKPRSE